MQLYHKGIEYGVKCPKLQEGSEDKLIKNSISELQTSVKFKYIEKKSCIEFRNMDDMGII